MAAAAIGVGVQALGGALGGYGKYAEGEAAFEAERMNAQMARENAVRARRQAADEEQRFRIQTTKQIGDIRSSYGASGVVSSQGSALDVLQESAAAAELDALNIRHAGEMQAWEFNREAQISEMRGRAARSSGRIGAASGILGTAGRLISGGIF